MKAFIKYICGTFIALWMVLPFFSCNSLLEEKLIADQTTDNYYVTEQGYEDLVKSAYAPLRNIHRERDITLLGTDLFTQTGDPEIAVMNGINEYSVQELNPQSAMVSACWDSLYSAISRANTAIDRADRASISDAVKTVRIGEARFLRGLYYFYLVQQFGDLPLVVNEITEVVTTAERTPQSGIYAQIIEDLEMAIQVLPAVQQDYGRATKGAAQHVLAKVYLARAYSDFTDAGDLSNAIKHATDVIGSGTYQLLPSFADVFRQGNETNKEIIFSVQYSGNQILNGKGNNAHSIFGQGVDGLIGMDRSSTYNRQQPRYVPSRFLSTRFDPDTDSRYDATFLRIFYATVNQGNIRAGDTVLYFPRWDQPWSPAQINAAGYIVVNPDEYYMNPDKRTQFPPIWKFFEAGLPYGDDLGTRDLFVFRLAETYLIAAEAYLKSNDPANALQYINEVRRRAAFPGQETAMELTSVTIDDILDERARELCGEEFRWNELKRTGKLIERVKQHNELAAAADHIRPYHLLRPIPLSQIERSSNDFPQNPGY